MMTAIVRSVYTRSSLQPPRRAGLRFPSPVGHGRGLATRPGCAVPLPSSFTSFGCGSAKPLSALSFATGLAFTRFALSAAREPRCVSLETHSTQPPPLRLCPASPTPEERGNEVPATTTGSQPLLACARDSLCLPGAVPYRLRKDGNAPNIPAYPSASTACRRPSLCSDADLLCPLSALTLATGQVFTADHASCFIVPLSLP